mgnify:CR=1 FL=1
MSDPNNTLPAVEPQDQYSIEDDVETTNTRSYSQGQLVLRRFFRHKAAMVALEAQLVPLGIHQIKLRVAQDNPRALALYQELGFTITGYNMAKHLG